MKFIDEAVIKVQAGKGGAGARSFRREKFVPYGGPDGGEGGDGGSVVLVADSNTHTLLDFTFQPRWQAENGAAGEGGRRAGKSGKDLLIKVPVGTEVTRTDNGEFVTDLAQVGERFVLAKGGRGGKGNEFFKTPTNQAPEHHQPGEEGEVIEVRLSLKLVADVGLIGFPNAGKSTLISRISAARPKIADYPFTTLVPNLGVVRTRSGRTFVVADIPGLIEGAHEGKGLGIKFLKHVERTKILAHLIDPFPPGEEAPDPLRAFDTINNELRSFSEELGTKPQIAVITKIDALGDRAEVERLTRLFTERGVRCLAISSVSGDGLDALTELLADVAHPPEASVPASSANGAGQG